MQEIFVFYGKQILSLFAHYVVTHQSLCCLERLMNNEPERTRKEAAFA